MSRVFTSGPLTGSYIISEVEHLSRGVGTFAEGAVVEPGTVLGRITLSGKLVPLAPAAEDGSEDADSIAFDRVDAAEADADGVITEALTAVNGAELIWPAGITENAKAAAVAALKAKHIKIV